MHPLQKMKADLKARALEISEKRTTNKRQQRARSLWENANPEYKKQGWNSPLNQEGSLLNKDVNQWAVVDKAKEFRVYFVAYCILRGRTYEQIEPKVRSGNEIDMNRVEKIMQGVKSEIEALLSCTV